MGISSRTPEGSPNRCPLCGSSVRIEPSLLFGDAPCPCCGHLLWFLVIQSEPRFFMPEESAAMRERVFDRLSQNLGVSKDDLLSNPSFLSDAGVDSLDIAELLMELEEDFE